MTSKRDIIKRWIQKAESDLKTARILMEFEGSPTESICFHSQQAVEKLLKAYLTFTDTRDGLCITQDHSVKIRENSGLSDIRNL